MGRSRYKITDNTAPHFVTFTVLHWIPIFTNPATVNIIFNSLKFLQKEGLKINAFVILENHMHFILQSDNLSKGFYELDMLGSIISAPHDNDNLFHFPAAYQRLEELPRSQAPK
jgi:REP element-mobilizing transposase RayT